LKTIWRGAMAYQFELTRAAIKALRRLPEPPAHRAGHRRVGR